MPSINVIGGALAVLALGALLYFGLKHPAPIPAPAVSTVAPLRAPQVLKPPGIKKIAAVPAPVPQPRNKYRRVLKGGKLDGEISCKEVPAVAHQFTPDQVLAAAAQYGLSPAQLSALRVCLN